MCSINWSTHVLSQYPSNLQSSLLTPHAAVTRIAKTKLAPLSEDELPFYKPRSFIKAGQYENNDEDYFLDPASVLPVVALDMQPRMRTLDLCAAPGGKSLLLASRGLNVDSKLGEEHLVVNEASFARFQRLKQNIGNFYNDRFKGKISVVNSDPTKSSKILERYGPFNRILVDAPCSSDRHRYSEDPEMKDWSLQAVKRMAKLQKSLLGIAAGLLTQSGRIVYSTCALAKEENDEVVASAFKRGLRPVPHADLEQLLTEEISEYRTRMAFVSINDPPQDNPLTLRRTQYGFIVLPCDGGAFGPIYLSALTF